MLRDVRRDFGMERRQKHENVRLRVHMFAQAANTLKPPALILGLQYNATMLVIILALGQQRLLLFLSSILFCAYLYCTAH